MIDCTHIHINKTGGTSIEVALWIGHRLDTAAEKRTMLRDRYDQRFSFSFVRNPWDRLVSMWLYRIRTNQIEDVSFRKWVLGFPFRSDKYHSPQLDWLKIKCEVRVDWIGRFEHLEADFKALCILLDVDPVPELPHAKRSPLRGPYWDYYDDETRRHVEKMFIEDISFFNYEFAMEVAA